MSEKIHRTVSIERDDWDYLQSFILGQKMSDDDKALVGDNQEDWDFSKWLRRKILDDKGHGEIRFNSLNKRWEDEMARAEENISVVLIELQRRLNIINSEMKTVSVPAPATQRRIMEAQSEHQRQLSDMRKVIEKGKFIKKIMECQLGAGEG